jgi:hypothetical protein
VSTRADWWRCDTRSRLAPTALDECAARRRTATIAPVPSQVTETETSKQHRYAWVVAAATVSTAETFAPDLVHAGWHSPLVMALSFYLGVLGGLAWQRLNRVEFVDRFIGWAVLLVAVMLLPLLAPDSSEASSTEGAWALPGVITGVVLAEGWMRQRRRP